jgi:mRNA-degrading endonuclease toxin of MazEF toxin-antitoxin module
LISFGEWRPDCTGVRHNRSQTHAHEDRSLDFGPVGAGRGYRRPVVIVQADAFGGSRIATVLVAAVAAAPGNVWLPRDSCGLDRDSATNFTQFLTVDRSPPARADRHPHWAQALRTRRWIATGARLIKAASAADRNRGRGVADGGRRDHICATGFLTQDCW